MVRRSFGSAYLKRTLRHNSMRRGLLGGSRFWLVMLVAGKLLRWSSKVTKSGVMPIHYSEPLEAGESLIIRHVEQSDGGSSATRGRRQARR